MVTRTFLSILTLVRGQVPSTIDTVRRRRTIVLCSSSTKYTYIVATQILYSGYILWSQTPPHYPQKGKKINTPPFLLRPNHHHPQAGRNSMVKKITNRHWGKLFFRYVALWQMGEAFFWCMENGGGSGYNTEIYI